MKRYQTAPQLAQTNITEQSTTVIISDMNVLLCGSSQNYLGTQMPSGGFHIINVAPVLTVRGLPRPTTAVSATADTAQDEKSLI